MFVFDFRSGFIFDRGGSGFFLHVVKRSNHDEDNEGDNEEVDDGGNEISVVDCRRFDVFDVGRYGDF